MAARLTLLFAQRSRELTAETVIDWIRSGAGDVSALVPHASMKNYSARVTSSMPGKRHVDLIGHCGGVISVRQTVDGETINIHVHD